MMKSEWKLLTLPDSQGHSLKKLKHSTSYQTSLMSNSKLLRCILRYMYLKKTMVFFFWGGGVYTHPNYM